MGVTTRRSTPGNRKRAHQDEDEEEEGGLFVSPPPAEDELDSEEDESESDSSSEGDSDDDAQDITGECEHDENDEPFPGCIAYDRKFATVIDSLVSMPRTAVDLLNISDCNSSRVQNVRACAEPICTMQKAKRERIALLGNTGAGKTCLIEPMQ